MGPAHARARRRLQHCGRARGAARLALARLLDAARRRARALRPAAAGSASKQRSGGPSPGARRGTCGQGLGERRRAARAHPRAGLRRGGRAGRLAHRPAVTRDLVYGRRPVREVFRAGRREVLELWATERAVKAEAWLRELERPRVQVKLERELMDAAGTRDHQGVVAWCEPYKYADAYEVAAAERPLLACLDQVSDPRNLGAVCRSAEGAGATGVVVPSHGAARVTAAVCRASAGAVEHLPVAVVTNLARYLEEIKGGDLWIA